eukprot:CAMPEP_0168763902 /NCGR_PEP_ID=MMETSP0724-20121128/24603_1 /TAXON_ID=265536 /ORGANISM="Amphiprora sp., Strain CCMP467" /LENGTH=227 /DNA_ID=CAMNT_0008813121 /DNA_START=104 /DNA_END=784 /DNA_ORIENTATION=+
MTQENQQTNRVREIRRVEEPPHNVSFGLPTLPEELQCPKEDTFGASHQLLHLQAGQLIRVHEVHRSGLWKFGTVLYDPLVDSCQDSDSYELQTCTSRAVVVGKKDTTTKSKAQHDNRTMQGWFPTYLTVPLKSGQLHELLQTTVGSMISSPFPTPDWWVPGVSGPVRLQSKSTEYKMVQRFRICDSGKSTACIDKSFNSATTPLNGPTVGTMLAMPNGAGCFMGRPR